MPEAMQFQDGESYESMMGVWSALIGTTFLDWLKVPPGARWADVGCGNGASTELIVSQGQPVSVEAIDASEPQLSFARKRHQTGIATFTMGSALELPYPDASFDAAMMALVIFFVPDPAKAVAEMRRVVRPGGAVAAYAWDIEGGGFPYEDVHAAMRAVGAQPMQPPRSEVAALEALGGLWTGAGLSGVETREITANRLFSTFEEYWSIATSAPGIAPVLARLGVDGVAQVRESVASNHSSGPISISARAHAVKGRVSL